MKDSTLVETVRHVADALDMIEKRTFDGRLHALALRSALVADGHEVRANEPRPGGGSRATMPGERSQEVPPLGITDISQDDGAALDSPPFRPAALDALAARGYQRVNVPRPNEVKITSEMMAALSSEEDDQRVNKTVLSWPEMPVWSEEWDDDKTLPEDVRIYDAFPTRSGRHDLYAEAMRLVGAKRSKGGLVALVNWLLHRADVAKTFGRQRTEAPFGPKGRSRADALRDVLEQIAKSEHADAWARALAQGTLDADDEERGTKGGT